MFAEELQAIPQGTDRRGDSANRWPWCATSRATQGRATARQGLPGVLQRPGRGGRRRRRGGNSPQGDRAGRGPRRAVPRRHRLALGVGPGPPPRRASCAIPASGWRRPNVRSTSWRTGPVGLGRHERGRSAPGDRHDRIQPRRPPPAGSVAGGPRRLRGLPGRLPAAHRPGPRREDRPRSGGEGPFAPLPVAQDRSPLGPVPRRRRAG